LFTVAPHGYGLRLRFHRTFRTRCTRLRLVVYPRLRYGTVAFTFHIPHVYVLPDVRLPRLVVISICCVYVYVLILVRLVVPTHQRTTLYIAYCRLIHTVTVCHTTVTHHTCYTCLRYPDTITRSLRSVTLPCGRHTTLRICCSRCLLLRCFLHTTLLPVGSLGSFSFWDTHVGSFSRFRYTTRLLPHHTLLPRTALLPHLRLYGCYTRSPPTRVLRGYVYRIYPTHLRILRLRLVLTRVVATHTIYGWLDLPRCLLRRYRISLRSAGPRYLPVLPGCCTHGYRYGCSRTPRLHFIYCVSALRAILDRLDATHAATGYRCGCLLHLGYAVHVTHTRFWLPRYDVRIYVCPR